MMPPTVGMKPPGSRASLAGGFVSPAMTPGQAFWFCLPRVRRMLPPASFAGEFDAVGVVNETIEDGVGIGRIADYFVPLVERELAGNYRGAASVAFLEDFQEIVPGGGGG